MAETYCGKSCAQCVHKEAMNCPGCKPGPGRQFGGDCELAKCARIKGHETCSTCGLRGNCGQLRSCHHFPEYRRRKLEEDALRKAALARRVPVLGKWLWILFWLVIPSSIAGLISNETLGQSFPGLYMVGQILGILCSVAYGLILLKLGSEEDRYRTAGIFALISGGLSAVLMALPGVTQSQGWVLLLAIPVAIVELVSEYHEYNAHSAVVTELDGQLSEKWETLWKWFIGLYLGLFGCVFVTLLAPVLGALSLIGALIGILVVSILKLVYLYRTAKLFREYHLGGEDETQL